MRANPSKHNMSRRQLTQLPPLLSPTLLPLLPPCFTLAPLFFPFIFSSHPFRSLSLSLPSAPPVAPGPSRLQVDRRRSLTDKQGLPWPFYCSDGSWRRRWQESFQIKYLIHKHQGPRVEQGRGACNSSGLWPNGQEWGRRKILMNCLSSRSN